MNEGIIQFTTAVWEEIGSPKIHHVKEALLFPDEYEVRETTYTYDHGHEYFEVLVASESIPESKDFGPVRLMPVYRKIDQIPEFVRMEVIQ